MRLESIQHFPVAMGQTAPEGLIVVKMQTNPRICAIQCGM